MRARQSVNQFPIPDIPIESPVAEIVWRELRPIFDEELNRLPDKLRLPVVLCFLEGQTKRSAARSLGWPEGTFSCRLQQARELLQSRLARRGITLSAGAVTLALFEGTAAAAVSPALASTTVQALSLIAAGSALSGPVAALSQGVVQSMFITKLKITAALIVTVGVLGGGTGWVLHHGSGNEASAWAAEPGEKPAPQPTSAPAVAADPEVALKAALARATSELASIDWQLLRLIKESAKTQDELRIELKNLLDRRDRLLAQQREIDDEIAKLKLEVVRRANQKKNLSDPRGDEDIELVTDAQQREIENLKKMIADLQAQNAELRKNALSERDRASAQENQAKLNADLERALAELRLKEVRYERIKRLAEAKTVDSSVVDEAQAELAIARAEVEKVKAMLAALGGGRGREEQPPAPDVKVAEAELKQCEALLQVAKAKLQLHEVELAQAAKLLELKSITQELYDKFRSTVQVAKAEVAQAEASCERAKVILELARKQAELKPPVRTEKLSPADRSSEIDSELRQILKLLAEGKVTEAEADKVRIAVAEARIRSELGMLVSLREREVARAKQLLESKAISPDEYKKAVDRLDALKRWQAQWK